VVKLVDETINQVTTGGIEVKIVNAVLLEWDLLESSGTRRN